VALLALDHAGRNIATEHAAGTDPAHDLLVGEQGGQSVEIVRLEVAEQQAPGL
jgi:hypothetical protein